MVARGRASSRSSRAAPRAPLRPRRTPRVLPRSAGCRRSRQASRAAAASLRFPVAAYRWRARGLPSRRRTSRLPCGRHTPNIGSVGTPFTPSIAIRRDDIDSLLAHLLNGTMAAGPHRSPRVLRANRIRLGRIAQSLAGGGRRRRQKSSSCVRRNATPSLTPKSDEADRQLEDGMRRTKVG
jgi:hypothetical protein